MSLSAAGLLKLQKKEARWRGGIKIPLECNSNVLVCGRSLDYRRESPKGLRLSSEDLKNLLTLQSETALSTNVASVSALYQQGTQSPCNPLCSLRRLSCHGQNTNHWYTGQTSTEYQRRSVKYDQCVSVDCTSSSPVVVVSILPVNDGHLLARIGLRCIVQNVAWK